MTLSEAQVSTILSLVLNMVSKLARTYSVPNIGTTIMPLFSLYLIGAYHSGRRGMSARRNPL